jgi:hypothetical protein
MPGLVVLVAIAPDLATSGPTVATVLVARRRRCGVRITECTRVSVKVARFENLSTEP